MPANSRCVWTGFRAVAHVTREKTNVKKKKQCSEEQIIGIQREVWAGVPVRELCRKYGLVDAAFHTWRSKLRLHSAYYTEDNLGNQDDS